MDVLSDELKNMITNAMYKDIGKTPEQIIKEIDNKILEVIDALQNITEEYASWDLWDDAETINKSLNILKERYQKELIEKYVDKEEKINADRN